MHIHFNFGSWKFVFSAFFFYTCNQLAGNKHLSISCLWRSCRKPGCGQTEVEAKRKDETWRSNKPSRSSEKDEASAKITPGGQLIGPLVHKIFNLDSCPWSHKTTNKYKIYLTHTPLIFTQVFSAPNENNSCCKHVSFFNARAVDEYLQLTQQSTIRWIKQLELMPLFCP